MKKGFTLIELIAVIVILGFILLIIIPTITDVLNDSKQKLNDTQQEQIVVAARNWGLENVSLNEDNTPTKTEVTIATLQNEGYLEDKEIKSLLDKKAIDTKSKVCITYENNQFVYEYKGLGDC